MLGETFGADFSPNKEVVQLLQLWRSKALNNGYPGRRDFSPFELKIWLGNIELIDVVSDKHPRYRYRLVGTNIVEIDGLDPTGRFAEDVFGDIYDEVIADYDKVCATGEPVRRESEWLENRRKLMFRYDKLVLPLATNGRDIDGLLVYLHEGEVIDRAPKVSTHTIISIPDPAG